MAGAALAAASAGLFRDPLLGIGAALALFGGAALLRGVGAEGVCFGSYSPAAPVPAAVPVQADRSGATPGGRRSSR